VLPQIADEPELQRMDAREIAAILQAERSMPYFS
jgi:hypothetical protein